MRFSPFVPAIAVATLVLNGAFLLLPVFGQSYGDVQVRKNPDGSIETFDSSDSSAPSPRPQGRSTYKKGTHRFNDGVVVRKNADGSIETFDSGGGSPAPHRSSAGHSSSRSVNKHGDGVALRKNPGGSIGTFSTSGLKSPRSPGSSGSVSNFVHKYPKGTAVKVNPDGTIEVIGNPGGSADSKSKGKSHTSAKSLPSAKASTASKPKRRAAHRPRGHGNFGDVRVIRNPDGSIETYDAN